MKIIFVSQTPLAGMPWRTTQVLNRSMKDSGGWAKTVIYNPQHYGNRTYFPDSESDPIKRDELFEEADIVILPANLGEENARGRPCVWHYSMEPHRWIKKKPNSESATVVAQYQARFATHLEVMPNCIPVDNAAFKPQPKDVNKINIIYTPTTRAESGWGRKSFPDAMLAFRRLLNDPVDSEKVNIYLLENQPYEVVMAARQRAHIVIDDCSTGSYHSTSLEGLSCGASVINWTDSETKEALNRLLGDKPAVPFIDTGEKEIYRNLKMLIDNPGLLKSNMEAGRTWMQENYSEKWQAETWLTWLQNFLQSKAQRLMI